VLSKDQEKYIQRNYRRKSVKYIAKHTNATITEVQHYINSIKTVEEKKREKVFRIITISFPLIAIILLEVGLRIGSYGVDVNLFHELILNGKPYYEINEHVSRKYFRRSESERSVSLDVFEKKKSSNTYRIFVLGESAALGYPYLYNGAFSGMVRDRLQNLLPEKNIEVVNVAMTAVSSYVVVDFAKQILDHEPDLLLIYTGHNEFYGCFGVGSSEYLGKSRSVVKTYLFLEQFKTFVLLQNGVAWIQAFFAGSGDNVKKGTMMEQMVRNKGIEYGSDDYLAALNNFRANLEEVVSLAKRNNVGVIIGTLASNLRGMPPFVSLFSPTMSEDQKTRFENLYAHGVESLQSGGYSGALDTLKMCVGIDSMPAKMQFALGKCYEQLGDYSAAKSAYSRARDYDGLHFRAPSDFNAMIADLCKRENIPLAESEKFVADRCAHGIIGPEMMLEHVHLNVDGYFTIAKAFCQSIADHNVIAPKEQWKWSNDKSDAEYRKMAGVTEFDSTVAAIKIFILTNSWPFTEKSVTVNDFVARTELEQRAKSFLAGNEGWEQAHVAMAENYVKQKRPDKAAEEYLALIKGTPFNASPYVALGQLKFQMGDTTSAESLFAKSLQMEETFIALNSLGLIYYYRGAFAPAAAHFSEALKYPDDAPPQLYQLAERLRDACARMKGR
jgi:tetratricopeptide (TPR) repeat protein